MNIHSSADHTAEFLKLALRMISLDNCTWWNSWYLSLVVTDKHALSINTYIKNHFAELFKNYLTSQDWKRLCMINKAVSIHNNIIKFIKKFKKLKFSFYYIFKSLIHFWFIIQLHFLHSDYIMKQKNLYSKIDNII